MLFTLVTNTPYNLKDLIDSNGYVVSNVSTDGTILVKISHKDTNAQTTKVYIEGCSVTKSNLVVINDLESDYITYGHSLEISIDASRLKSVSLLACCSDTDIHVSIF
jgi:hypothetical protein